MKKTTDIISNSIHAILATIMLVIITISVWIAAVVAAVLALPWLHQPYNIIAFALLLGSITIVLVWIAVQKVFIKIFSKMKN